MLGGASASSAGPLSLQLGPSGQRCPSNPFGVWSYGLARRAFPTMPLPTLPLSPLCCTTPWKLSRRLDMGMMQHAQFWKLSMQSAGRIIRRQRSLGRGSGRSRTSWPGRRSSWQAHWQSMRPPNRSSPDWLLSLRNTRRGSAALAVQAAELEFQAAAASSAAPRAALPDPTAVALQGLLGYIRTSLPQSRGTTSVLEKLAAAIR